MNVLSLFDGMSGGQIALKKLGVTVNNYYAGEIDKHAVKLSSAKWPNMKHLGDIEKWREWDIDFSSIDLILAGSPCQGFSFAGKGLAFDDPRSKLFFVFVDILTRIQSINPNVKYLLENVRMKKEHEAVITSILGVQPIFINSALVSAQNRKRLYWTNVAEGMPQPADKVIYLKDILQESVDEKYYVSDTVLQRVLEIGVPKQYSYVDPQKAGCLIARMYGNGNGNFISDQIRIVEKDGSVKSNQDNPTSRQAGLPTQRMLEPRYDGKTNCLTTVAKDNLVKEVVQLEPIPCDCRKDEGVRIKKDGKSGTLLARARNDESCRQLVLEPKPFRIRRLTPIECCRLQTVPDDYFFDRNGNQIVSDTQIYKMLGNGWTVDVIAHILWFNEF